MDYLNPNSLIQGGRGLYDETGFGAGVDNGILRQLQAENQMRQANSANMLEQAKNRAELPNQMMLSRLNELRNYRLASPEMMKSWEGGATGEFDQKNAAGQLAMAGLPQKLRNEETNAGIAGVQSQQLLSELKALVQQNPSLAPIAQQAMTILGAEGQGGGSPVPFPGILGNPQQVFASLQPFMSGTPDQNSPLSSRMAALVAGADKGTQSKLMEQEQKEKGDLMRSILSGQFGVESATSRASTRQQRVRTLLDYITKPNGLAVAEMAVRSGIDPVTKEALTQEEITTLTQAINSARQQAVIERSAATQQGQTNQIGIPEVAKLSAGSNPPAAVQIEPSSGTQPQAQTQPAPRLKLPEGKKLSVGIHEDKNKNKIQVFPDGTYVEIR